MIYGAIRKNGTLTSLDTIDSLMLLYARVHERPTVPVSLVLYICMDLLVGSATWDEFVGKWPWKRRKVNVDMVIINNSPITFLLYLI